MMEWLKNIGWMALAVLCAVALGIVAGILNPAEEVNGL